LSITNLTTTIKKPKPVSNQWLHYDTGLLIWK